MADEFDPQLYKFIPFDVKNHLANVCGKVGHNWKDLPTGHPAAMKHEPM